MGRGGRIQTACSSLKYGKLNVWGREWREGGTDNLPYDDARSQSRFGTHERGGRTLSD